MRIQRCLLCVDGMMPAGIDPIFGPVYRICPCCHTRCLDCDGAGIFPAAGGYALELLGTALDALGYQTDVCRTCFGTTNLWSDDHHISEDQADTIHRVENVLRQLADDYYTGCRTYFTPPTNPVVPNRALLQTRLMAMSDLGDKLAEALGIAAPDWEAMRDLAKPSPRADHPEPGLNP